MSLLIESDGPVFVDGGSSGDRKTGGVGIDTLFVQSGTDKFFTIDTLSDDDLRELVPDLAQEIRYASGDNFVGRPVEGYGAARCYLLRPVAQALQRVELALRREGLRLKVYDCYRPARAVRDFVVWAGDLHDHIRTVEAPLNSLNAEELSPGTGVLAKINAALR